jgi:hypothetical protein
MSWLSRRTGKVRQLDPAIIVTDDGFHLEGEDSAQVRWSSIRRIATHKLDLLTTDEIRLTFEHDDSELIFEVSEEQPGFQEFKRCLEQRFNFPVDWWESVMKPAFARNPTILFTR